MDSLPVHPIFTKNYFEELLRNDRSDSTICVTNVQNQLAVAKGENYASQLQRITVEFESADKVVQSVKFIAKFDLQDAGTMGDVINDFDVFRKEIECYTKLIPAVESLLRSIGDDAVLAPKCLDANYTQRYLVFEDLSASNYATTNRHDGLDVQHFKLLLSKLAKWHAATAVLIKDDPNAVKPFLKELFDNNSEVLRNVTQRNAEALADAARELPAHREIADKIEAILPTLWERIRTACGRNEAPSTFNVITHGDLWSNNIMFTRDATSGQPIDAKFVDFQMGCYTSHVMDLQYALYSSSHRDLTAADWTMLIEFYYEVLAETLSRLKYPEQLVPTLDGLWSEWRRIGAGSALGLHTVACVRMCTFEKGYDMTKMFGTTEADRDYRRDAILKVSSLKSIEFLLDYSNRNGFYDN